VEQLTRVTILGVILQDNLGVGRQVAAAVSKGAQSMFALRTLRNHGLSEGAIFRVCTALFISRLTYALPAWSGFASAADWLPLQSVFNKASRWGLTGC